VTFNDVRKKWGFFFSFPGTFPMHFTFDFLQFFYKKEVFLKKETI